MMHRPRWSVPVVLLGLATALLARSGATEGEQVKSDQPVPKGQRVFVCGHSFHMPIAAPLRETAHAAGITDQQLVGIQGIGGSQVLQHWNLPDDQNKVKKALRAGAVDVLTLAPHFKVPDEGIDQ